MNTLFKLAYRNLVGAGVRTWLNVGALSFGFVIVIWMQGLYEGMLQQMTTATIDGQYGGGQYWHEAYDPFDPLTLDEAHGEIDPALNQMIQSGIATPILQRTGTIYLHGRARTALLNGIEPGQDIINLPAHLIVDSDNLPIMIGERMARDVGLVVGDVFTLRWRDVDGTFDAADVEVVAIMKTLVPSLDMGQIWLQLEDLRAMLGTPNEATYLIVKKGLTSAEPFVAPFEFKDIDFLLADERALYVSKKSGGAVVYFILMSMGLLAVFDTQVLAIFRRRKEIGTLMALGMNRREVVSLFTLEGSMNGLLAIAIGALWGIPLMVLTSKFGIHFPEETMDSFGFAMGAVLYTHYVPQVYLVTLGILLCSVIVVSFLPARRISRLKATDALRGKLS